MSIRVGILGYVVTLGRGVECAVKQNDDMRTCGSIYKKRSFRRDNFDRRSSGMQWMTPQTGKIRSTY